MPRGSKESYTNKQKRQAKHIEDSEEKSGKSPNTAVRIAWATVNKETGGAGKRVHSTSASKKGGKMATHSASAKRKKSSASTAHI